MVDFTTVCMVLLDLQFDLLCDLENTLANSYLGTFDYGGEKNEKWENWSSYYNLQSTISFSIYHLNLPSYFVR